MMNKMFYRSHRRQRYKGLTILETLISATLLLGIIYIAMMIYNNMQRSWTLAQQEAQLQQYSRTAMTRISQELRQATSFHAKTPDGGQAYSSDIQFTVPEASASTGLPTGNYTLVRYWYEQNTSTKVYSLYRAYKSNGTDKNVPSGNPPPAFIDNKTTLLKEAAVVDPGLESYFYRTTGTNTILIHLVTATYKPRSDGAATTAQEQVILRKF